MINNNSKIKILLQCQGLTYLYMGLGAIYTKFRNDDIIIDCLFTKPEPTEQFIKYVSNNKYINNLFLINWNNVNILNKKISKIKNKFFDKVYYKFYLNGEIKKEINNCLKNNKYSYCFYSEGSDLMNLIYHTLPHMNYIMYGDGSGLIWNGFASKLISIKNNYVKPEFVKILNPNEIISLAPYKEDNSINIDGVPISSIDINSIIDIINQDKYTHNIVKSYTTKILNNYKSYDKKIILMTSSLEDARFMMPSEEQINIYVDILDKYSSENSLVIIKQHPTSKINLANILEEKCKCTIIGMPPETSPLPIEVFSELVLNVDNVITFLSSSIISLKILYDVNGIDAWDIVQKYQLKHRVNIILEFYNQVIKNIPTWDKKSLIYEENVIPKYERFYNEFAYKFEGNDIKLPDSRKNKFLENIFSIRNIIKNSRNYKMITFLGLKIKLGRNS